MVHFPDSFQPAADVLQVVQQLISGVAGFEHLKRATVGCLSSARAILDRGVLVPACILIPAQISSKQVERVFHEWALARLLEPQHHGELPDFVLYTDLAQWTGFDRISRERLVFHELSHIQQRTDAYDCPKFERDGRPSLGLRPHDAELFYAEVERYGRLVPAVDETAIAIAAGIKATKPQRVA